MKKFEAKVINVKERNNNYELIKSKMNFLFKEVLSAIESKKDFKEVRKLLLDRGNEVLEIVSLVLNQNNYDSITIPASVMEQINASNKNKNINKE